MKPEKTFARDGFPIDPILQRRAKRAALGFAALAICYAVVLVFRLAQLTWDGMTSLANQVEAQVHVLIGLVARIAAGALLALAAWQVIAMRRWSSEAVVWLAGAFALWAAVAFGLAGWHTYREAGGGIVYTGVMGGLLLVHLACFEMLRRAVGAFNAERFRVLSERAGLIRAERPLGR